MNRRLGPTGRLVVYQTVLTVGLSADDVELTASRPPPFVGCSHARHRLNGFPRNDVLGNGELIPQTEPIPAICFWDASRSNENRSPEFCTAAIRI